MKIILEGLYKNTLFKEFIDDYGNPKDVGQNLLQDFLEPYLNQESPNDDKIIEDISLSENDIKFLEKMQKYFDDHTLRYAKIDFLFWFEFQNRCQELLKKLLNYLCSIKKDMNVLDNQIIQQEFVLKINQIKLISHTLFDIINCERCTNIGYYSLLDDCFTIFMKIIELKVIGVESTLTSFVDLFDSLFVFSVSSKQPLKFGQKPEQIKAIINSVLDPFLQGFLEHSRQISKITSKKIEEQVVKEKIESYKKMKFTQVEGLEYKIKESYQLSASLVQLLMNYGLPNEDHSTMKFERLLPPQYTFEVLIEALTNQYLSKHIKIMVINVMQKLIQLDMVSRFHYDSSKKNPYFNESIKYLQVYIEIFQKITKFHTEQKLEQSPILDFENMNLHDQEIYKIEKQQNYLYLKNDNDEKQENEEMRNDDIVILQNNKDIQIQSKDTQMISTEDEFTCKKDENFIGSQNFLNDFINYLSNIAKVRIRSVNSQIFPQITADIVKLISMKYDTQTQMYPVNLNVQSAACKFLKDVLKSQQSFDDTSQLNKLIQKLKSELQIIKVQSQVVTSDFWIQNKANVKSGMFMDPSKMYLRLYEHTWPNDDDFLAKYQTLLQRQLLVKQLLRLLCFCIKRNDPNLISYNQNFIAHSRKILESSILQDDILLNIFKIHETLPFQQDKESKDQIEETVSPLVLTSIQLVTHVFNDLPSKIQTFMQNGLFHGVITSLTQGGIPTALDMIYILLQFVHLMTLNQDARNLLIESQLIFKIFNMCLNPEKYHRFIAARRRDDLNAEQLLINIVNSDPNLCDQIFQSFINISNEIHKKSQSLSMDYLSVDQQIKQIEDQIAILNQGSLEQSEDEIQKLEVEKNQLKLPHELNLINFENFFTSYYILFDSLFENHDQNDILLQSIKKREKELHELAIIGFSNPVIASALHQVSNEYINMVLSMLKLISKDNQPVPSQTLSNYENHNFMKTVFKLIQIQIQNFKDILLKRQQFGSSLTDDQIDQNESFQNLLDILPERQDQLQLFEDEVQLNDEYLEYREFINKKNNLTGQDQAAIVLNKIYFYAESLILWFQQDNKSRYNKVLFLKEIPGFDKLILDLFDLSTLITKNRGINYSKTIQNDLVKIQKLIAKYKDKITDFDYETHFKNQKDGSYKKQIITSEIGYARKLYFKYFKDLGDNSITKNIDKLQESADVMNFESEDVICTNAQACQNQTKRLLKNLPGAVRTRKLFANILDPQNINEQSQLLFCVDLGQKQVAECNQFIGSCNDFLEKYEPRVFEFNDQIEDSNSEFQEMTIEFDKIMFNLISALFQTNKIISPGQMSGGFIYGLISEINESQFFVKLMKVCIRITLYLQSLLQNKMKIPMFRISYLKVMWKDVFSIFNHIIQNTSFIPNSRNIHEERKFLVDFNCVQIFGNMDSKLIVGKDAEQVILNYAKINLQNQFRRMYLQLSQSFFNQQILTSPNQSQPNQQFTNFNILVFLNRFCPRNSLQIALKIFENSLINFNKMAVFTKDWQGSDQQHFIARPQELANYLHLGDLGRQGRFEVYIGNQARLQVNQNVGNQEIISNISNQEEQNNQQDEVIVDQTKVQDFLNLSLGFKEDQIIETLKKTNNNLEESIKILFEQKDKKQNDDIQKKEVPIIENDEIIKQFSQIKEENQEINFKQISLNILEFIFDLKDNLLISQKDENGLIFQHFDLDDNQDVYGYHYKSEIYFNIIQKIFLNSSKVYNLDDFSRNVNKLNNYQFNCENEIVAKQQEQQIKNLLYQQVVNLNEFAIDEQQINKDLSIVELKDLVVKLYIFQIFQKFRFQTQNPQFNNLDISMIQKILNIALQKLQKLFQQLKTIQYDKLVKKCEQNESIKIEEKETQLERQIIYNHVPLLKCVIKIGQELLLSKLADNLFDFNLQHSIQMAKTVKDFNFTSSQPSEELIQERIHKINIYHTQLRSLFGDPKNLDFQITNTSSQYEIIDKIDNEVFEKKVKQKLESMIQVQILLLKTFNNTPLSMLSSKGNELHYPISISLQILKYIFQINDFFQSSNDFKSLDLQNEIKIDGKNKQNIQDQVKVCQLRKLFIQSDGLKYIFGVKIINPYCESPSEFAQNPKMINFIKEKYCHSNIITDFIGILANNSQSLTKVFENQIKQLMLVQFRQNYKRETKQDIFQLMKSVTEAAPQISTAVQILSPKQNTLQKNLNFQNNQKQTQIKTVKNQSKNIQANANVQNQNLFDQKNQQKHLKMLLKKHENYNEVPLTQFLDFFIKSQCILPQVGDDLDLFILACRNTCHINVVESEVSNLGLVDEPAKKQKTVTIKLKESLLKELLIEFKNCSDARFQNQNFNRQTSTKQKGQQNKEQNWTNELKKQLNDIHLQNEVINQLLDFFIHQNKGYKMSILKQLKSKKALVQDVAEEPYKLEIRDGKTFLKVEPFLVVNNIIKNQDNVQQEEKKNSQIKTIEMQEFLFDTNCILNVISHEISKNPSLIGVVLKHKEQKTYKYIIRNIFSLNYLKLIDGQNMQLVFQENQDTADPRILTFFRAMLLDRHTVSEIKKIFRVEARKIFIKEITKNLVEYEKPEIDKNQIEQDQKKIFNFKLLQSYTSFLLVNSVLMSKENEYDAKSTKKHLEAINQSIRRFNKAQKWNMVLCIIHEIQQYTQISNQNELGKSSLVQLKIQDKSQNVQINFFRQIQRIKDEIENENSNPNLILYRPKALTKSIDIVFELVNQFIKIKPDILDQILGNQINNSVKDNSSKKLKKNDQDTILSEPSFKKLRSGKIIKSGEKLNENNEINASDSGIRRSRRINRGDQNMQQDEQNKFEEMSLTIEDQMDIQELRNEERRSNHEFSNDQDDIEDDSEFSNAYNSSDDEMSISLEEEGELDLIGTNSNSNLDSMLFAQGDDEIGEEDEYGDVEMEDENSEDDYSSSDVSEELSEDSRSGSQQPIEGNELMELLNDGSQVQSYQEEDEDSESNSQDYDNESNSSLYGDDSLDEYDDEEEEDEHDDDQQGDSDESDEDGNADFDQDDEEFLEQPNNEEIIGNMPIGMFQDIDDNPRNFQRHSESSHDFESGSESNSSSINRRIRARQRTFSYDVNADLNNGFQDHQIQLNGENGSIINQILQGFQYGSEFANEANQQQQRIQPNLFQNRHLNNMRRLNYFPPNILAQRDNISASQSAVSENSQNKLPEQIRKPKKQDNLNDQLEYLNKIINQIIKESGLKLEPISIEKQNDFAKIENCLYQCDLLEQIYKISQNNSVNISLQLRVNLFQGLMNILQILIQNLESDLKIDINLYISNINILNDIRIQDQKLDKKYSNQIMNNEDNVNDQHFQSDSKQIKNQLLKPLFDPENNETVKLEGIKGFEEFKKAIRLIGGEETLPEPKSNQIDSSSQRLCTLSQIDPLFAQALNAPSIQAIKDNDQLIKKIQKQSSLGVNQNVQTINDFIKKQPQNIKQEILRTLEPHILTHLSSDLYAEAKRLRIQPNINPRLNNVQQPVENRNLQRQRPQIQQAAMGQAAQVAIGANQGRNNILLGQQGNLRNRLISMDYAFNDKQNQNNVQELSQLRDSESEDINIPIQKINLNSDALIINLHEFMKENIENLQNQQIKDQIKQDHKVIIQNQQNLQTLSRQKQSLKQIGQNPQQSQIIYTNHDLRQYCEELLINQFKEKEYILEIKEKDQISQDHQKIIMTNVEQLIPILDIAITDILCSKASMQFAHISSEKLIKKFNKIIQIPNFRVGLIIKIIQVMNKEISSLHQHIQKHENLKLVNDKQVSVIKKMPIYTGSTKIWETIQDTEPKILSTKSCLIFMLKYIYQIQQILFDQNSNKLKLGVLELLKSPNSDLNIKILFDELGLSQSFNLILNSNQFDIQKLTLLDLILQMIVDYIYLLEKYPEAFELQEIQEKEFYRWKQEILQNVCLILQQIFVGLNILERRKNKCRLDGKQSLNSFMKQFENVYSFNMDSINCIFSILFFIDNNQKEQQNSLIITKSFLPDNSKRTIQMISKVLNRLSAMPIQIPQGNDQINQANSIFDLQSKQNILRLYQIPQQSDQDFQNQDIISKIQSVYKQLSKVQKNIFKTLASLILEQKDQPRDLVRIKLQDLFDKINSKSVVDNIENLENYLNDLVKKDIIQIHQNIEQSQKYIEIRNCNDIILEKIVNDKFNRHSQFSLLKLQMLEENKDNFDSKKIVQLKIQNILNQQIQQFYSFFFQKFNNNKGSSIQALTGNSKQEKQTLLEIIEKTQHIFKVGSNLTSLKQDNKNETQRLNLCGEQQLIQLLDIVQMVIDDEEKIEQNQIEDLKNNMIQNQQSYIYKEEFKSIMQLIFTLSQYELKNSKIDQKKAEDQNRAVVENHQEEEKKEEAENQINQPRAEIQLPRIIRQPRRLLPQGNRLNLQRQQKNRQAQVFIQSIDQIKALYDKSAKKEIDALQANQDELTESLKKFEPGITHHLIKFLFKNKVILNHFIHQIPSHSDSFLSLISNLPQLLNFSSKRLLWRHLIKKHLKKQNRDNDQFYEIDIQVRRNQVFGDSFEQLKDIQVESWKQKFSIEFHDEEGVDEGGLTKEWFQLVSQGIFDPNYALFQQSANGSTYYPNPKSEVHEKEEMIQLYKFIGRIIGKALNEGQLLDCYFVRAFYKMMLGETLELSDLQDFDQEIYKSLIYMLENDAEILCQNFMVSFKFFDEQKNVELKEGGKDIEVTNENKFEYCHLVLEYLLYKCVKTQIDSFLEGFHDLVPQNLISIFDYKEVELMISGLPVVDIEDLKDNVIYKNFTKQSPAILWLWEVLEELNNSERAEFIQFITGSSKVPVEGFKGLRGSNGQIQKVEIIKLNSDQPDRRLPQAHTCFFQLDLPEYSSKNILKGKLIMAIKEGKTFNIA